RYYKVTGVRRVLFRSTGKCCDATDDCREYEQRYRHRRPTHTRPVLLQGLKLLWQLRIADLVRIEVRDRDPHPVFYFARPKVVQRSEERRVGKEGRAG